VKSGRTFDGVPGGGRPLEGEDEVFLSNVDRDPGESKNLRRQNPALVDELLTMAEKWLADVAKP
jgi:hypothetical protein